MHLAQDFQQIEMMLSNDARAYAQPIVRLKQGVFQIVQERSKYLALYIKASMLTAFSQPPKNERWLKLESKSLLLSSAPVPDMLALQWADYIISHGVEVIEVRYKSDRDARYRYHTLWIRTDSKVDESG